MNLRISNIRSARESLSRGLLQRLIRRSPEPAARLQLQVLMNMTARSFGLLPRRIWHLSSGKALHRYAVFTKHCMSCFPASPHRLYREAYRMGDKLRRLTGLSKPEDLQALVFYLYHNIGIRMQGRLPGEITISRCYFSRLYTPNECAFMASMDLGIIAGLFQGGTLAFSQRITQGCQTCRACFSSEDVS